MGMSLPLSAYLLLCVWYCLHPAQAGYDRTCYMDDRRPHRRGICGEKIDIMLDRICALTGRKRRSVGLLGEDDGMPVKYSAPKRSALSYLGKRSNPQGFMCECCYNQCRLGELQEYCT